MVQDDELRSDSNGKLVGVAPSSAASPPSLVVLLVDDSRLRRYNCGLRSETRGNPRERRLLSVPLYGTRGARARVHTCRRCVVCATSRGNPYPCASKRERERGELHKSDPARLRRAVFPINPVFRVLPPTLPWGCRFAMLRRNRRSSIVNSIDRPKPRGLNFFAGYFNSSEICR